MHHRVVIVGGGFGGLHAAQSLRRSDVEVTLIDRRNFHLFQPLLYQVATGGLSPADISSPLRGILNRQKNAHVIKGEVVDFEVDERQVKLRDGVVDYHTLIVATGTRHHYFGNDSWEECAPGLKTIEDATDIRRRVLSALEQAEREPQDELRRALMTFVVVGGGPTGVELAGALAELTRETVQHDFRSIDTSKCTIVLVEGADRILPAYPPQLSEQAAASLQRLGVRVRTQAMVTDVKPNSVTIKSEDQLQVLPTCTVLWAAGVQASPLGKALASATGATLDRQGRVMVEPNLSLPGHSEIFVIGDLANFSHQGGDPLPGIAPVAMQQGRYVARLITQRLRGKSTKPFRYKDRGQMAVIGRSAAVADLGRLRFGGFVAWIFWLFIHLINLVEYQNRVLVLVQWAWNYFTRNRSARLITHDQPAEVAANGLIYSSGLSDKDAPQDRDASSRPANLPQM